MVRQDNPLLANPHNRLAIIHDVALLPEPEADGLVSLE